MNADAMEAACLLMRLHLCCVVSSVDLILCAGAASRALLSKVHAAVKTCVTAFITNRLH